MRGKTFFKALGNIDARLAYRSESPFYASEIRDKAEKVGDIIKAVLSVAAVAVVIIVLWIPSVIFRDRPADSTKPSVSDTSAPYTDAETDRVTEMDTEAVTEEVTYGDAKFIYGSASEKLIMITEGVSAEKYRTARIDLDTDYPENVAAPASYAGSAVRVFQLYERKTRVEQVDIPEEEQYYDRYGNLVKTRAEMVTEILVPDRLKILYIPAGIYEIDIAAAEKLTALEKVYFESADKWLMKDKDGCIVSTSAETPLFDPVKAAELIRSGRVAVMQNRAAMSLTEEIYQLKAAAEEYLSGVGTKHPAAKIGINHYYSESKVTAYDRVYPDAVITTKDGWCVKAAMKLTIHFHGGQADEEYIISAYHITEPPSGDAVFETCMGYTFECEPGNMFRFISGDRYSNYIYAYIDKGFAEMFKKRGSFEDELSAAGRCFGGISSYATDEKKLKAAVIQILDEYGVTETSGDMAVTYGEPEDGDVVTESRARIRSAVKSVTTSQDGKTVTKYFALIKTDGNDIIAHDRTERVGGYTVTYTEGYRIHVWVEDGGGTDKYSCGLFAAYDDGCIGDGDLAAALMCLPEDRYYDYYSRAVSDIKHCADGFLAAAAVTVTETIREGAKDTLTARDKFSLHEAYGSSADSWYVYSAAKLVTEYDNGKTCEKYFILAYNAALYTERDRITVGGYVYGYGTDDPDLYVLIDGSFFTFTEAYEKGLLEERDLIAAGSCVQSFGKAE